MVKGRVSSGVSDSAVMVTGRQKSVLSVVKVVKASCSSGVTAGG